MADFMVGIYNYVVFVSVVNIAGVGGLNWIWGSDLVTSVASNSSDQIEMLYSFVKSFINCVPLSLKSRIKNVQKQVDKRIFYKKFSFVIRKNHTKYLTYIFFLNKSFICFYY